MSSQAVELQKALRAINSVRSVSPSGRRLSALEIVQKAIAKLNGQGSPNSRGSSARSRSSSARSKSSTRRRAASASHRRMPKRTMKRRHSF